MDLMVATGFISYIEIRHFPVAYSCINCCLTFSVEGSFTSFRKFCKKVCHCCFDRMIHFVRLWYVKSQELFQLYMKSYLEAFL